MSAEGFVKIIKLEVRVVQKEKSCISSQERASGGLRDPLSNLAMLSTSLRKGKIRSYLPATLAFLSALPYPLTEELLTVLIETYLVKWKLSSGKQIIEFDLSFP